MKNYINYGKKITEKICTFGNHGIYGGRQAGSPAEHRAADFLEKEMRKIGLEDVRKEAFSCDTWEFRDARLEGEGIDIRPYAYASGSTGPEGIEADLVYAGRGTEADYRDIDAAGKIVLIDIDMDVDWWIDAPTLEAAGQGAAAVINSCSGGYAGHSDDAMNCQDFCGPVTIPSVNISRRDAGRLKTLCGKGRVPVRLTVDNPVRPGGTSYNITGIIPGRNPEELIIIGDHYDSHFQGFQDNAAAVGLTLAIAKGVVESGYTPERTLLFILHGAEEWGAVDTRYDWAIGAWNQVNRLHPEWFGRAVCYINFELPALEADSSWYMITSAEHYTWASEFLEGVEPPAGCYPDGIRRDHWPVTPWSDDWSYTLAGIPAFMNGMMLKKDGTFSDFIHTIYHSQYDNADTWKGEVFAFNYDLFNSLLRRIDSTPMVPLDFSVRGGLFLSSLHEDVLRTAGVDVAALRGAAEGFIDAGRRVWQRIADTNGGTPPAETARGMNRRLLAAFKRAQDALVRFTWTEEPVFPHQPLQANIHHLQDAQDALTRGDRALAAEKCAAVDNNYLAPHFSREVFRRIMNQTLDPAARDRQFWGSGRIVSAVDLYDEIRLLESEEHIGAVLAMLDVKLEYLQQRLKGTAAEEAKALEEITAQLEEVLV